MKLFGYKIVHGYSKTGDPVRPDLLPVSLETIELNYLVFTDFIGDHLE